MNNGEIIMKNEKIKKFLEKNPELSETLFLWDSQSSSENLKNKSESLIEPFPETITNLNIVKNTLWFAYYRTAIIGLYNDKIISLEEDCVLSPFCQKFELLPYEFIRRGFYSQFDDKEKFDENDVLEAISDIFVDVTNYLDYLELYKSFCKKEDIDYLDLYLNEKGELKVLNEGYYNIDMNFKNFGLEHQLMIWKDQENSGIFIAYPDENSFKQFKEFKHIDDK